MLDIGQTFIEKSRGFLIGNFLPKIELCIEKLSDDEIWWRANEESNSIGNLMLHLSGNIRQWIVGGVGGAPDRRERQEEFDARRSVATSDLRETLRQAVQDADTVLAALSSESLLEKRSIQGHNVTVMEAIYHVVEHFSMHTGQIIILAKMRKGDLHFYDVSSGTPRPQWSRQRGKPQETE